MTNTVPAYAADLHAKDEISILEIVRALVSRRKLIASIGAACMALGLIYLLISTPIYRADAFIKQPDLTDVDVRDKNGASLRSLEIFVLEPDVVYREFLTNLRSRSIRRKFFDKENLLATYIDNAAPDESEVHEIFEKYFNSQLVVDPPDNSNTVRIYYHFVDPKRAAQLLNAFIERVNQRTIERLLRGIEAEQSARIDSLRANISRKLRLVQTLHNDQIERLIEAAAVAEAMNLHEGIVISETQSTDAEDGDKVALNSRPLYLRGVDALQSQIAVLKARKSIEPFTEGLRELQSELAFLEDIEIDDSNLRAVIIDQAAIPPGRAVKPRPLLILLLSAVVGLFLGGFVALTATAIDKQRARAAQ